MYPFMAPRQVGFLFHGVEAMSTDSLDSFELADSDISLARDDSDAFGTGLLFC